MRAVVVRSFGGPEVLEVTDVPVPEPGPGQVRIRVTAAAVNPVDLATRSGALHTAGLLPALPVVGIGWDVAGVIDTPPTTGPFTAGDAVVGLRDRLPLPLGTQAEYVVLDASAIAHAPRTVSPIEASTLPLNGSTALQALDLLDLPPGGTVLVTGASGAVGGFAVQLAAIRGLRVVALGRKPVPGATWFVPRDVAHLGEAVRAHVPGGVDGVVDAAALGVTALDAVRGGGSFVAVLGSATPVALRGIRVANVWIQADGRQLASLVDLVDRGELHLPIPSTLPLADVARAHSAPGGKVVLLPPADAGGPA